MKIRGPTAMTVRSIRLVGGIVLMTYVTGHLTTLGFGLVSLDLLDRLRVSMMSPWQTVPGQVLLYGAIASHLVLGLVAVARRRSPASLNRSDLAQLALGLLIPLFLAGHVLRTRGGIMLDGNHATYGVLMVTYWKKTPFLGLLQVLGLVAAWVHGCLGLYGWLRLRRWWPAVAPFLYPGAFVLPILALLGFVEAGKEALARFADGSLGWSAEVMVALRRMAPQTPILLGWRDRFLFAYAIAAGAALFVFVLQAVRHRRPNGRVIHAGGPEIPAILGLSLLEIDRRQGVPHASACSGRARCGTCRVRVLEGLANLSPPGEAEAVLLQHLQISDPDIRLACQAILLGAMVTIERLVPADAEEEAARDADAAGASTAVAAS